MNHTYRQGNTVYKQILQEVSQETGYSIQEIKEVVEGTLSTVKDTLESHELVTIKYFGKFTPKYSFRKTLKLLDLNGYEPLTTAKRLFRRVGMLP